MSKERTLEIAQTMTALWEYWVRHPELRLGQLISNMAYKANTQDGDPFYATDAALRDYIEGADS